MVSNNAQRLIAQIGCARFFCHRLNQIAEQVDFIVGINVLQHGGNTFQAHTGIHRRFRQRFHRAVSLTVELHKHDVPDLNVTVAIFLRAPRRTAPNVVAVVEENFGARAARASIAHLPEVIGRKSRAFVVADTNDALARDANFFFPNFVRFVIRLVNGDP